MDVLDNMGGSLEPANMFPRFAAFLIDAILLGIVQSILMNVTDSSTLSTIAEVLVIGGYYGFMEGANGSASVGKRVMGLRVCDVNGGDLSFGIAALRGACHILSGAIFAIGYIMAFFTERKQALHDLIAGTLVVRA